MVSDRIYNPTYYHTHLTLPLESPRVSLHGGPIGFDYLPWTLVTPGSPSPPSLFTSSELSHLPTSASSNSHAIFRLVSPDGDQGYPGKLVVEALVALVGPGEQERRYRKEGEQECPGEEYDLGSIVLVYRAKLDVGQGEKVVTPVNLTQHWGFNLDASLKEYQEEVSVKGHTLTMKVRLRSCICRCLRI